MLDKCAEVANAILLDIGSLDYDPDRAASIIRSAFPPPAEDAWQLVKNIRRGGFSGVPSGGFNVFDLKDDEAAAEISRFAESRVEPWREALKRARAEMLELHGGDGDSITEDCCCIRDIDDFLLSDSPAKEDAK